MSTRTCRDVRPHLSAYLDGDLDGALTGAIRAHLETCAACRSELDLLRLTIGALRRLPDLPPPAAILTGVRACLRPEPWHRRLFGGGLWRWDFPLSAAATVLVVLGISLFVARYPDMPTTVPRESVPQSPVSPPLQVREARQSPIAPSSPDERVTGDERQAPAAPTAAPARRDLRAKGALGSAARPREEYRRETVASPEPTAGADAKDLDGAAPAAQPGAPAGLEVAESKVEPSPPPPPAPALKDAPREESHLGENISAEPPRPVSPVQEPASERTLAIDRHPDAGANTGTTSGHRAPAALAERDGGARTNSPQALKMESRAAIARKPDSYRDLMYADVPSAKEKTAGSNVFDVACLLLPEGGTVTDLERFLGSEGAIGAVVSALEPAALRDALTPRRGRFGNRPEPSRGWTITARVQGPELTRLLAALAGRIGLIILDQPAAPAVSAVSGDPPQPLDLRITVFR